ncbi:MAG: hypothetical protein ACPG7F_13955 [Aggregatilineales bacterium]
MAKRPFHQFTADDDAIWQVLYEKQYPMVQQHAHSLYLTGLDKLEFSGERMPDFARLNEYFQDTVGWELLSTDVQYSDGQDWFERLANRQFLVTEYIRPMDSLDYTPMPDIWHDAFGHLPFLVHQEYADYLQEFGERAIRFSQEERRGLGSLWWYSVEFGLMPENDMMKAVGAGLMSSYKEMKRTFDGTVIQQPYSIDVVTQIPPSPHEVHETLFVIDDFPQMIDVLREWSDTALLQAI